MADRLIDPPFGTTSSAPDPIIDLILSCNTQKTTDGRERREAEKELEMQEKKKLNRKRIFDESTDSFGVQWRWKRKCYCRVARMSRVPGVATKGFC